MMFAYRIVRGRYGLNWSYEEEMVLSLSSSAACVALHRKSNAGTVNVRSEIFRESNTGRRSLCVAKRGLGELGCCGHR